MSSYPGSAAVFQIPDQEVAAGCASGWCELWAVATQPGALTAVAIVGVLALVAFAYVRDAEAECRAEQRRVLDERDAFEAFADRVAEMRPAPAQGDRGSSGVPAGVRPGVGGGATGGPPGGGPGGGDVTLRRVIAAYSETVLSLPHYSAEYDETVAESLAAELGPDTATALASDGGLSDAAQTALVERSRRAAEARTDLAAAIGEEIDELSDREDRLSALDRRRDRLVEHLDDVGPRREVDAAIDVWNRLTELEVQCDDLAADRQRSLDDPPLTPASVADDDRAFYDYLYGPADGPDFPVLAQIASVADRAREDRRRVESLIADGR